MDINKEKITDAELNLLPFIKCGLNFRSIKINGFLIRYVEVGYGEPLLLLHGANIGWGQWYKNICKFSHYYKVYALDMPGSGGSIKESFRFSDLENDLVRTVDEFVIANNISKLSIIGHSLGGWVALKLALSQKKYINKLVLVDPVGLTKHVSLKQKFLAFPLIIYILTKTTMRLTKNNIKAFLQETVFEKESVRDEFVAYVFDSLRTSKNPHPFWLINKIVGFLGTRNNIYIANRFKDLKIKTLVIVGKFDHLVSAKQLLKATAINDNVKTQIFEKTGHVPPIERDILFNKAVLNFLTQ